MTRKQRTSSLLRVDADTVVGDDSACCGRHSELLRGELEHGRKRRVFRYIDPVCFVVTMQYIVELVNHGSVCVYVFRATLYQAVWPRVCAKLLATDT